MLDIISLVWGMLVDCGFPLWVIVIAAVVLTCSILLVREYGKTFFKKLVHRKNLTSLVSVLLFFCIFFAGYSTGIFLQVPKGFRFVMIILYAVYVGAVLYSVKGPVLFSWWYLKRCQKWLNEGKVHEHQNVLKKKPWFFLDENEKTAYQLMKGSYLHTMGNVRGAYEVVMGVDAKWLYPEEDSERTWQVAMILMQLGNIQKANQIAVKFQKSKPYVYGYIKSFLEEAQGNIDAAWCYAKNGEDTLDERVKNPRFASMLYNQLGRLSCFKGNLTQMFHYYFLALDNAKKSKDHRLLHPAYQNLILQIQQQGMYVEQKDKLMQEYVEAMSKNSQHSTLEMENFLVALARQQGDKDAEYAEIIRGYRLLHENFGLTEQCLIEVCTLNMINKGGFDPSSVLEDIAGHFDSYFTLPLPARFTVLQGLPKPNNLTFEQEQLYDKWTPRLAEYAKTNAMKDLTSYERQLSSDCVYERCWVIKQRVDFVRRSSPQYNGQQILQWMNEIARIYEESGLLVDEIIAEVQIVKQYIELIGLGQLPEDEATIMCMRTHLRKAFEATRQLPNLQMMNVLSEIIRFSLVVQEIKQAEEAYARLEKIEQAPKDLVLEMKREIDKVKLFYQTHWS